VRDRQRLTLAAVTLGIRKSAPELASLISAVPASAAELTRQLDPGEVGVQYFVHGEKLYALTFGAGGTRGFVLDGAGLADEVERFRALMMRIHPGANVLGQALYRRLIAPLESVIAGKPLLIVPHASLHYVPFAALSDGKRYLAQKHALRVMSSASALQYLRRPVEASAAAALILGNPTLDLPSAEEEARKLGKLIAGARVLVGPQATKQALIVGGGNYRTIHIASHGEYDPDQPLESRLLLAQSGASVSIAGGEKAAGILKVTEVYGLRLQADLVTLSSCESGLGRITDGGDVIGLTRGFLYAGATTVVASLWKVADDATLELMERFYANLARMDKREALRSAQIETARKFPHPFFWAAFYLTGVGR
jgi:CHAT domain-containing protein